MEVLNYPIADLFMNLVRESTDEIKLCSPFIKESIINEIYDNMIIDSNSYKGNKNF